MSRHMLVAGPALVLFSILVLMAGCTPLGGPPLEVKIAAESDSTVAITWSVPAEGTADSYLVYFQAVRDSGFTLIAETTGTAFVHNPHGVTGRYKVGAKYGNTVYESKDTTLSTVPVHSDTMTLFELNADSSKSGYGWDTLTGKASRFSMVDSANAALVDFYVSDLRRGRGQLPYVLISPNVARTKDSGAVGIVPQANWRVNGLHTPIGSGYEHEPVPRYDSLPPNYYDFMELPLPQPNLVPLYTNMNRTEDKRHYALVKVHSVDTLTGAVVVESWFQRVPRLRLMKH